MAQECEQKCGEMSLRTQLLQAGDIGSSGNTSAISGFRRITVIILNGPPMEAVVCHVVARRDNQIINQMVAFSPEEAESLAERIKTASTLQPPTLTPSIF